MLNIISDIFPNLSDKYDFAPKDIERIKDAISPYQYSKKDLMRAPERFDFRVDDAGDRYVLHNFHNDSKSKFGICEELAYKASKKLNNMFEGKYIFFTVESFIDEFHMFHNSLRALPVKKLELLKELLYKSKEQLKLQDLFADLKGSSHEECIREKINSIKRFNMESLKSSLLVDPSFQIVKNATNFDNQSVTGLLPRKLSNPFLPQNIAQSLCSSFCTFQGISLGFAKQYLPELKEVSDKAVLLLSIVKDYDIPLVYYYLMEPGCKRQFVDKKLLQPENLLIKFAEYIKKSLKTCK